MNNSTPYLVNQSDQSKEKSNDLPYNMEAEQQLLGALIRNNDLIDKCNNTKLKAEHFYIKQHGQIYERINKSLSTGKTANLIFLKTYVFVENWPEKIPIKLEIIPIKIPCKRGIEDFLFFADRYDI